jgi:hypothetical protein
MASLIDVKNAPSPTNARKDSKAVGGTQPTALPSSPIRTAFLGGNRRDVETRQ